MPSLKISFLRNRLRDREQTCGCQGRGGGRKDWEFGISRCKLLYRIDKQQGPTV